MPPRNARKRAGTTAPQFDFDETLLAHLEAGDDAAFDAGSFEGVGYAGIARELWALETGDRVESCRFEGLEIAEWRFRGTRFAETLFTGSRMPVASGARSDWRDLEVRDSRFGSLEGYESTWRGVRFIGCRIGYLNLRGAELLDVAFVGCTIDDLDLMDASARRVAFEQTRLGELNLTGVTLTDVDLRGADLGGVTGLGGLRGATVSPEQLPLLAPALAEHIGLRIED